MARIHMDEWPPYSPSDQAKRDNVLMVARLMMNVVCDYTACAAQHRVETRVMFSIGAISMLLGHLKRASFVLSLPLGPADQNLWFNREAWKEILSFEQKMMVQIAGGHTLWMAFSGGGNLILKTKPRW